MQKIDDSIHSLYGLPGYGLVFISCIIFGYVLRAIKNFPNGGIPLCCFLWGGVFNVLVAPVAEDGMSTRIWITVNFLVGVIVGGAAWFFHKKFLKNREDGLAFRFPVLGRLFTTEAEDGTKTDLRKAQPKPSTPSTP